MQNRYSVINDHACGVTQRITVHDQLLFTTTMYYISYDARLAPILMYRQHAGVRYWPISYTCYRTPPKGIIHLPLNSGWLIHAQWSAAIDVTMAINKLHTVYWQYHSFVVALPLVPTALVAIQQQTRDICQYMVCNLDKLY